jgi:hypothetical protein
MNRQRLKGGGPTMVTTNSQSKPLAEPEIVGGAKSLDPEALPEGSPERALAWRDAGYGVLEREQDRAELASWAPVDLGAILAGDTSPLEPTQLRRSDGVAMLYPGRLHDFHGEPETLKSLAAQLAVAQVLLAGGTGLYIDHEAEPRDIVGHLQAFNVPAEVIIAGLTYCRPTEPLANAGFLLRVCPPQVDISVIDGVDAAMAMQGLSPNVAIEYRSWLSLEVRPIQRATSGATVLIDHVTKNKETRGDWAAGTYQKRAAIDGASFGFELVQPFGVGRVGVARITLAKDRPGSLRGRQGVGREIARLRLESHHPADPVMITWEMIPPPAAIEGDGAASQWQPTGLMERVSRLLEGSAQPLSKNEIETRVAGRAVYIRQAIDCLVERGNVEASTGAHGSRQHRFTKPFREDGGTPDPTSSRPRPDLVPDEAPDYLVPSSPPTKGDEDELPSPDSPLDADLVPPGRSRHVEAISQ